MYIQYVLFKNLITKKYQNFDFTINFYIITKYMNNFMKQEDQMKI